MSNKINTSDAFTGLEAAIVLIAFVVAAVFSYVVFVCSTECRVFHNLEGTEDHLQKG